MVIADEISKYTVALYRESLGEPKIVGSGILVKYKDKYIIVSALHIFDYEDERERIEDDPFEQGITQDNMDDIMARNGNRYFYVNDNLKGIVWTSHYDEKTSTMIINEDVEFCVCELTEEVVKLFPKNKEFLNVDHIPNLTIKSKTPIIIAGYPAYAQNTSENYRSYESTLIDDLELTETGLFRVNFDQEKALCLNIGKEIEIPKYLPLSNTRGIQGMSGGGMWYAYDETLVPIGIMIMEDRDRHFVEGYSFSKILEFCEQEFF